MKAIQTSRAETLIATPGAESGMNLGARYNAGRSRFGALRSFRGISFIRKAPNDEFRP
ncbi:hypothetical protein K2D_44720 [Planctomycetes bacterium K2D]|uniref:Uncharacterized protein n=1 Tax=Botrimarina mediterranea TaxID=2528022 RepID=A0A518KEM3_9BACT|nr:hypothetical protein Spa11_44690 [Botrimarina mediterranea]QDV80842.1 hypothetical protein K2D_44720 [Planctomycetes bacterium K2D]